VGARSAARGAPPEPQSAPPHAAERHRTDAPRTEAARAPFVPPRWVRPLVIAVCCVPALLAVAGVLSDVFLGTRYFGSNPIKEVEHYTGKWVLRFLVLTLAITPARRSFGWNWLQRYRRTFGLFAFTYACLHLLTYAVLDVELTWSDMVEDVLERKYITIGMTAFALMLPLALTSTRGWIRRLGKRWVVLHRAVYAIVVLGTIHFWMAVKQDITEPFVYAVLFAALLGYRLWSRRRSTAPVAARASRGGTGHVG
jgi:sulfoxide reductase heme-binding subunit YedZ